MCVCVCVCVCACVVVCSIHIEPEFYIHFLLTSTLNFHILVLKMMLNHVQSQPRQLFIATLRPSVDMHEVHIAQG